VKDFPRKVNIEKAAKGIVMQILEILLLTGSVLAKRDDNSKTLSFLTHVWVIELE
jgi:hypothetical protein